MVTALAEGRDWTPEDYQPECPAPKPQAYSQSKDSYSSGSSSNGNGGAATDFNNSGSDNNISYQGSTDPDGSPEMQPYWRWSNTDYKRSPPLRKFLSENNILYSNNEYGSNRYTGFGNQKQSHSTPMSPMHSGNEVVDNTLASLASGWSLFASTMSKAARTATESAVRYGGIATQKVSEMATTVTEKVNNRSGWSSLSGATEQRRGSTSSQLYQSQSYGAMSSSTSEPYSQWNEQVQPSIAARNNLDTSDLSRVGVSSPPPNFKTPTNRLSKDDREDSWDWLNN